MWASLLANRYISRVPQEKYFGKHFRTEKFLTHKKYKKQLKKTSGKQFFPV